VQAASDGDLLMTLDEALGPYAGPCAFCGRPDKRHRLFDAIKGTVAAGCTVKATAWDFDLTPEAVEWVVAQKRFPVPSKKQREQE
jgi:hypothetical protein